MKLEYCLAITPHLKPSVTHNRAKHTQPTTEQYIPTNQTSQSCYLPLILPLNLAICLSISLSFHTNTLILPLNLAICLILCCRLALGLPLALLLTVLVSLSQGMSRSSACMFSLWVFFCCKFYDFYAYFDYGFWSILGSSASRFVCVKTMVFPPLA